MPIPFKPLPDGEPPLDTKQFLFRLKHDPGFAETMQAHYEAALALPLNDDTAELHKSAAAALRALKHHQGAWLAQKALLQGQALMDEMPGDDITALLPRLRALTDEASDHLLDVQEPDRTRYMKMITGVRQMVRELEEKQA